MSYATMLVIAGLLFKFTTVKMRGPNKSLNRKNAKYGNMPVKELA